MEAWAAIEPLARRPVTTVHFGGGTPSALNGTALLRMVEGIRRLFGTGPETEWAVESTSGALSGDALNQLAAAGFRRLHIGVQTLEDGLRRRIGRRENAATVLERLGDALRRGFVTSADVIYGLPAQTAGALMETLRRLVEAGVHGISLYRLNVSPRNRSFLEKCAEFACDARRDYGLFQVAHDYLLQAGFGKNHFDHFARSADGNLYATHAARGLVWHEGHAAGRAEGGCCA